MCHPPTVWVRPARNQFYRHFCPVLRNGAVVECLMDLKCPTEANMPALVSAGISDLIEFRAIRRGSAALREQAVDETLDVRGVDVAVAIGVGGAGRRAVEENVDEELDV